MEKVGHPPDLPLLLHLGVTDTKREDSRRDTDRETSPPRMGR